MYKESEQLSFFNTTEFDNGALIDEEILYSEAIYNSFEELDFRLVINQNQIEQMYNRINNIIPPEKVTFIELPLRHALICELVCAAICNNINWDFLRKVILEKSKKDIKWFNIEHLQNISAKEIDELFLNYSHIEKVDSKERSKLLRELAHTYDNSGFESIFFDSNNNPKDYDGIRTSLLRCKVFSGDIIEKKIQLLIMKISKYDVFNSLAYKCKPTIDYHIIRTFTRRGYLIMKDNKSINFVNGSTVHQEKTIAAVRKHCANIISNISKNTNLSILDINSIEWWIGRSICLENEPDCLLCKESSNWLKLDYNQCPFYNYCLANREYKQLNLFGQDEIGINLKSIESPNYNGNSF